MNYMHQQIGGKGESERDKTVTLWRWEGRERSCEGTASCGTSRSRRCTALFLLLGWYYEDAVVCETRPSEQNHMRTHTRQG